MSLEELKANIVKIVSLYINEKDIKVKIMNLLNKYLNY